MPDYYDNIFLRHEEIDNLDNWELLCRISGRPVNSRRTRQNIFNILSSLLINGTSAADILDWRNYDQYEIDVDTAVSVGADIVRNTLSRENENSSITLFPDARAVLVDTSDPGLDEQTRAIYENKNTRAIETASLYYENTAENTTENTAENTTENSAENESTADIVVTSDDMENMGPWDFLCKVTGINANGNSPRDVERLLTSIYLNGVRLSDTLQLGDEVSYETIEVFSDVVKNALDPDSGDFSQVTIRDNGEVKVVEWSGADLTRNINENEYDDLTDITFDASGQAHRTPANEGTAPQQTDVNERTAPQPQAAANDNTAPQPQAAANDNAAPQPQAAANDNAAPQPQAAANDNTAPQPQAAANDNAAPQPQAAANDNTAQQPQANENEGAPPQQQANENEGAAQQPQANANDNTTPQPQADVNERTAPQPQANVNEDATPQPQADEPDDDDELELEDLDTDTDLDNDDLKELQERVNRLVDPVPVDEEREAALNAELEEEYAALDGDGVENDSHQDNSAENDTESIEDLEAELDDDDEELNPVEEEKNNESEFEIIDTSEMMEFDDMGVSEAQDNTISYDPANPLPRWFMSGKDSGIMAEEFNMMKFDPEASAEENSKNAFNFISMLTGKDLTENSTPQEFKEALDNIVINNKSAKEFFGIGDEPKAEDIKNIFPKLTNAFNSVFNGTDIEGNKNGKTFIFLKANERLNPLTINPEHTFETLKAVREDENTLPENISSRIVSKTEIQGFIINKYENKLMSDPFANAANITYKDTDGKDIEVPNNVRNLSNERVLKHSRVYIEDRRNYRGTQTYRNEMTAEINDLTNKNPEMSEAQIRKMADKNVVDRYMEQNHKTVKDGYNEYHRRMKHLMAEDGILHINDEVKRIADKNVDNHNKYMHDINRIMLDSPLSAEEAESYNRAANAYGSMLNNEPISADNKKEMDKNFPALNLSLDDISSGRAILNALKDKEPAITLDDIYIGQNSLREITAVTGNIKDMTPAEIEEKANIFSAVAENFRSMTDPAKWSKDTSGKTSIPMIGIKTAAGIMPPVFTPGTVPEIKPEVKPLSFIQRIISGPAAIDKNNRDVMEYKQSLIDAEKAVLRNNTIKNVNEAIRINARANNGRPLTEKDTAFTSHFKINVPNNSVRPINLSEMHNAPEAQDNAPALTQPIIQRQAQNNGPTMGA